MFVCVYERMLLAADCPFSARIVEESKRFGTISDVAWSPSKLKVNLLKNWSTQTLEGP